MHRKTTIYLNLITECNKRKGTGPSPVIVRVAVRRPAATPSHFGIDAQRLFASLFFLTAFFPELENVPGHGQNGNNHDAKGK